MFPRFGLKVGNSEISLAAINANGDIEVVLNNFDEGVTKLDKQSGSLLGSGNLQMNFAIECFKSQFELAKKCENFQSKNEKPIVVLSVPKNCIYNDWVHLLTALNEAGFDVKQTIFDTAAAVLAHTLDDETDDTPKNVVSIRMSEQWTNITVFQINNGIYSVVYDSPAVKLGGEQCNDILMEFLVSKFKEKHNLEPNDIETLAKLKEIAGKSIIDLNTRTNVPIEFKSLNNEIDFNYKLTQCQFTSIIKCFLEELANHLNECKDQLFSDLSTDFQITDIVISGSTMKIPSVQNCIENVFSNAHLHRNLSPDEVAAIGCARQAKYWSDRLVGDCHQFCKTFVISDDMYIYCGEQNRSKRKLLFRRGTLLPQSTEIEIEAAIVQPLTGDTREINFFLITDSAFEVTEKITFETNLPCDGVYHIQVSIDHDTNDETAEQLQFSIKFL